jgi:hypothetical protein
MVMAARAAWFLGERIAEVSVEIEFEVRAGEGVVGFGVSEDLVEEVRFGDARRGEFVEGAFGVRCAQVARCESGAEFVGEVGVDGGFFHAHGGRGVDGFDVWKVGGVGVGRDWASRAVDSRPRRCTSASSVRPKPKTLL